MSKVIFFSFPCHGHTNPSLGLVNELVIRGEEVIYYSIDEFRPKIRRTGASFRDYGQELILLNKKIEHGNGKLAFLANCFLETSLVILPSLLKQTIEYKPDYIIFDSMCVWGRLIAEIMKIPSVSSVTMFPFFKGYQFLPTKIFMNFLFQLLIEQKYENRSEFRKKLKMNSKRIRYKYKVKDLRLVDIMNNFGNLNIVYILDIFHPISWVFNKSFQFIGPSVIKHRENIKFPMEKLKKGKVIYISLGTVENSNVEFYSKCMNAFANTDYQVVMSVGNKVDIEVFDHIPSNFIVRNYVPQLEILENTILFITHGGMNSVSEALIAGVPLIVVPWASDQPTVAKQVKKFGAGEILDIHNISEKNLMELSERILSNSNYKKNSKRIGTMFQNAGGYKKAADEIFRFKIAERIEQKVDC